MNQRSFGHEQRNSKINYQCLDRDGDRKKNINQLKMTNFLKRTCLYIRYKTSSTFTFYAFHTFKVKVNKKEWPQAGQ
jgi:hypothetical protein